MCSTIRISSNTDGITRFQILRSCPASNFSGAGSFQTWQQMRRRQQLMVLHLLSRHYRILSIVISALLIETIIKFVVMRSLIISRHLSNFMIATVCLFHKLR